MRLEPVDRPSSMLGRLMSLAMRQQLGKVITPARVVYNRVPRMWNVGFALVRLLMTGLRLPSSLVLLLQTRVAMLNGCTFCTDIAQALAVQQKIGLEKFQALDGWRESALFDEAEKAALAFVEEATRNRVVADATFEALRKHYDDRAIAEITVVNAVENFYNFLNLPLEIHDDGLLARMQEKAAAKAR